MLADADKANSRWLRWKDDFFSFSSLRCSNYEQLYRDAAKKGIIKSGQGRFCLFGGRGLLLRHTKKDTLLVRSHENTRKMTRIAFPFFFFFQTYSYISVYVYKWKHVWAFISIYRLFDAVCLDRYRTILRNNILCTTCSTIKHNPFDSGDATDASPIRSSSRLCYTNAYTHTRLRIR